MDYLTWHFKCPNCYQRYDMHELDYDRIPDVINEEFVCPGIEDFFNGQYTLRGRKCGNKFKVEKNMLYSISHRSWGELDAFVEGLIHNKQ